MSTAFDLIKRKWHLVKPNIFKMLPWEKETYCFALKKCQPTVFIKVGVIVAHDFLSPFSLIISPLMF